MCSVGNGLLTLCPLPQVSSASFETSAQPTPASMEGYVWPPTPRSSAAAHPASRATPANTTSTSVTWTRDPAPRAPPAITPWGLSSVSAPLGGRVHAADSGQDPAPPGAVSTGAPVNWFQGETPPSTCACVPQVCPHRGLPEAPLWAWRWCPVGPLLSAHCTTLSGFTGPSCEVNSDDCVRHQCQNGGTCQDGLGTYTCLCPEAWTGESSKPGCWHWRPRWSAPVLQSSQGPQLQRLSPSHSPTGWDCSEDVDECEVQGPPRCRNGGTCQNSAGDFHCVCVSGWGGAGCEENLDDCVAATCAPGSTCIDRVGSFSCLCPPGRTGMTQRVQGGGRWEVEMLGDEAPGLRLGASGSL